MKHQCIALFLAVVALAFSGCGGGKKFPVYPVTGELFLDKKPLAEAQVIFIPENGDMPQATGMTDASGKFTLSTYGNGDGAVEGKFKVIIRKIEKAPDVDPNQPIDPKIGAKMTAKSLIPPHYGNPENSGLSATIKAESNTVKFEIQSK
jgi:hypothetical protein